MVVVALITSTIIKIWKQSIKNWIGIALFAFSFFLIPLTSIFLVIVIIIVGIIGIFVNLSKKVDE